MSYCVKNNWPYADLSKEAGELGGPDALRKRLKEKGRLEGIALMTLVSIATPYVVREGVKITNLVRHKLRKRKTDFHNEGSQSNYILKLDGMTLDEFDKLIKHKLDELGKLSFDDPVRKYLFEEWKELILKRERYKLALEHLKDGNSKQKETSNKTN